MLDAMTRGFLAASEVVMNQQQAVADEPARLLFYLMSVFKLAWAS